MLRIFVSGVALTLLGACASQRCDKVQAYQEVRPRAPLNVPAGLSAPRAVSRAPEVDPNSPLRVRADGRCLEQPPSFDEVAAADTN